MKRVIDLLPCTQAMFQSRIWGIQGIKILIGLKKFIQWTLMKLLHGWMNEVNIDSAFCSGKYQAYSQCQLWLTEFKSLTARYKVVIHFSLYFYKTNLVFLNEPTILTSIFSSLKKRYHTNTNISKLEWALTCYTSYETRNLNVLLSFPPLQQYLAVSSRQIRNNKLV